MIVETLLRLTVHYIAAAKPFEDPHAHRDETLERLKVRVLHAFDLTEGSTVHYVLFHHKTPLENLQQTLGEIAGEHHELELKLAQHITQG